MPRTTTIVTTTELLEGLDSLKGTPPEQLKKLLHAHVDSLVDNLNLPAKMKHFDEFVLSTGITPGFAPIQGLLSPPTPIW